MHRTSEFAVLTDGAPNPRRATTPATPTPPALCAPTTCERPSPMLFRPVFDQATCSTHSSAPDAQEPKACANPKHQCRALIWLNVGSDGKQAFQSAGNRYLSYMTNAFEASIAPGSGWASVTPPKFLAVTQLGEQCGVAKLCDLLQRVRLRRGGGATVGGQIVAHNAWSSLGRPFPLACMPFNTPQMQVTPLLSTTAASCRSPPPPASSCESTAGRRHFWVPRSQAAVLASDQGCRQPQCVAVTHSHCLPQRAGARPPVFAPFPNPSGISLWAATR